jgi:acetylornithine deacetylase
LPLDPVETLQRLIRTPSVNPMGRDVAGSVYGESRLTDVLVSLCEQQRWPWSQHRVHLGRDNLLAKVQGDPPPNEGGELILWDVHQDTVSVEGMTVDPFGGEIRDGRVYGRGATDVKGAMAAMLAALSRPRPVGRRPTVILACTVNEECGFTGAWNLSRMWTHEVDPFLVRRPDAAIIAEPTEFNVVVAHQGVVRWRCRTIGQAAHTSRPDAGVNAIYAMAQIVKVIEQYCAELTTNGPQHPLCGRPSVCVSTISGGVGINTVPDRATIEIDRRLGPDERPQNAYSELISFIAKSADVGRCRVEHEQPFMESSGLKSDLNGPLAERLVGIVREYGRTSQVVGVPYGTDAAAIAATRVPTVVFGPGSIGQAHTADEFIEIDQINLATEIFYRIASEGLR